MDVSPTTFSCSTALLNDKATAEDAATTAPKTFSIDSLPSTPVSDKDKNMIRTIVGAAAPKIMPDSIVVLPSKEYKDLTFKVEHGSLGNRTVSNAEGSEEHFAGMGNTNMGDGFSIVGAGRMYLNGDLLKNPNRLREILTHELGHFQVGGGTEKQADAVKDKVLNPRAKAMLKNVAQIQSLPVSTRQPVNLQ